MRQAHVLPATPIRLYVGPARQVSRRSHEEVQSPTFSARANINSIIIALRGVVELYRRVGRVTDIYRRILGFSISYDDKSIRIFGYYPKIDKEEKASYY